MNNKPLHQIAKTTPPYVPMGKAKKVQNSLNKVEKLEPLRGPSKASLVKKAKIALKHLTKKQMIQILVENPKLVRELEEQHHQYSGKQTTKIARALRKRLRRKGVYLSKLGHQGARHD